MGGSEKRAREGIASCASRRSTEPGAVGLAILDAFAAGLPMVTTHCRGHGPEIAYLRQNENGLMTEDTLDDFVGGVRRVLGDAYHSQLVSGTANQRGITLLTTWLRIFVTAF